MVSLRQFFFFCSVCPMLSKLRIKIVVQLVALGRDLCIFNSKRKQNFNLISIGHQDGLLVEELAGGSTGESTLRALPLMELQAAIEAAAPPSPPAVPACSTPFPPSTPLPPATSPLPAPPPPPSPPACTTLLEKKDRKRRSDVDVALLESPVRLILNKSEY